MKVWRQAAGAKLDYTLDVTALMPGADTIEVVTWTVAAGSTVTISNIQFTIGTTSAYLTGGTVTPPDDPNNGNIITVNFTTSAGRFFSVSFGLIIDPYDT